MSAREKYGEAWVYESIVGAVPGVSVSDAAAVAIQFLLFELLAIAAAVVYGLWDALLAGTVAIAVAAVGSAVMLLLGRRLRGVETPAAYRGLLFSSKIEIVLGVLAFIAVVTYLFVYDARSGVTLIEELLGERPPIPAVYLFLLVLWDVCYRIGIGWWASVVDLWLAVRHGPDLAPGTRSVVVRLNAVTVGYAVVQLALVPFVFGHPVLVFALLGHFVAVAVVSGAAAGLIRVSRPSGR